MNGKIILFSLLFFLMAIFFAADIYAQEQNFPFAQSRGKNYDFNLESDYNYSNNNSLKENKKLALIQQRGNFNQADIWQSGKNSINSALIVQVGNDNQALIKQYAGNSRALIQQYGFSNRAEILQISSYKNLRVSQFGNNDRLKIRQN